MEESPMRAQLRELGTRLLERNEHVFGVTFSDHTLNAMVDNLGQVLEDQDDPYDLTQAFALRVRDHLLDDAEREGAEFWRTPLGRRVAETVGPGEGVTVAVAGACLGVSRQRIHELARAGRLARQGRITGTEVRDFIAARSAA